MIFANSLVFAVKDLPPGCPYNLSYRNLLNNKHVLLKVVDQGTERMFYPHISSTILVFLEFGSKINRLILLEPIDKKVEVSLVSHLSLA